MIRQIDVQFIHFFQSIVNTLNVKARTATRFIYWIMAFVVVYKVYLLSEVKDMSVVRLSFMIVWMSAILVILYVFTYTVSVRHARFYKMFTYIRFIEIVLIVANCYIMILSIGDDQLLHTVAWIIRILEGSFYYLLACGDPIPPRLNRTGKFNTT